MEQTELLKMVVEYLKENGEQIEISDEDKIKAAYALNMCTVSVSQIIDYSDLNILEQEYEAILNNLNLEQIPKDEALLHILKQLLDTITYFRIEDGEKKIIEKEYQQKMKNAIWASVPNFGMIVAGGNPITMAISLASQVGIGYMNYRRHKSQYVMEKDRQLWELQKTAIEQFNGLRRELFDTAWRLADTYDFPDGYRLTERQITQYNKILMDQDEVRKYERLEAIKDDFEAYPPFWYFIGNAANYIAGSNLKLSDSLRSEYKNKAIQYFEKFEHLNKYNILRQDQLTAACALEHIDLLLECDKPDLKKVDKLLDEAVRSAKNSNDIIELCALTYLKIGNQNAAQKLLRILVNEDYNKIINAQLLSSIYVYTKNRSDYELLATRVDVNYLFPMPEADEDIQLMEAKFGKKQKEVLKYKYASVLDEYLEKYSIEWNRITSVFELDKYYPEDFFLDTSKAKNARKAQVRNLYANNAKKVYYQQRMAESEYELKILTILNEMYTCLFRSRTFSDNALQQDVKESIKENLLKYKEDMNDIQNAMTKGDFSMKAYLYSQSITLKQITKKALKMVLEYAARQVDIATMNDVAYLESDLKEFCNENALKYPEIALNSTKRVNELFEQEKEPFGPELFGTQAIIAKKNAKFISEMTLFVKEKMNAMELLNDKTVVYFSDTPEFNGYFLSTTFEEYATLKNHSIMILKDQTDRCFDLIFTTNGIVSVIRNRVKNMTPYEEVKLRGQAILLYANEIILTREYKALSFDINILYELIQQLAMKFVRNTDEKIEYIEGTVNVNMLNNWFKEHKDSMRDDVTRIYAIPDKKVIESLGYHFSDDLDPDKNLIQCYFETKTGNILGIRIVQFDNINSNFQALLLENNGIIKVRK